MIEPGTSKSFFEFGQFRLDVNGRELLKDGEHIPLTQKSFEILSFLVRNHDRILRKEEILREVWTESFVEEANLAQHIYMVRKALKESGCVSAHIETIPKFGYKFVGEVTETYSGPNGNGYSLSDASDLIDTEETEPAAEDPHTEVPQTKGATRTSSAVRQRLVPVFAAAALLTLIVFATAAIWLGNETAGGTDPGIRAISILPFKQIGGNKDEKLGLGLADTVISRLGNQDAISISPTSAVARFAGSQASPLEIGESLGVDAVLAGTIQRDGDNVRVNIQLIGVKERAAIWTEKFDSEFSGVFALQDEIAEQVARKLSARTSGMPMLAKGRDRSGDPRAQAAFERASALWEQRSAKDVAAAIDELESAVSADPSFSKAFALLADCYAMSAYFKVGSVTSSEAIRKARAHASKALELDPLSSMAVTAKAMIAMHSNDVDRAMKLYRKAISFDPDNPVPHQRLAWIYAVSEDLESAIKEMRLAQKASPDSKFINLNLAHLLRLNRQTDEALEFCKKAEELDPSVTWTHLMLAEIYEQKGMFERSIEELKSVPEHLPERKTARLLMSRVLAKKGNKKEALEILKDVTASEAEEKAHSYEVATIYAHMGNKDEAVKELRKSEENPLEHYLQIKYDYNVDILRSTPEFSTILSESRSKLFVKEDRNS